RGGRPARGVGKLPIEVALPGDDGAGVAASHRDHDVGLAHGVVGQTLRRLRGDVQPHLRHRLDHSWVDLIGWRASGRADEDPALGVPVEERGGDLAPAGVVHANEQHLRRRLPCDIRSSLRRGAYAHPVSTPEGATAAPDRGTESVEALTGHEFVPEPTTLPGWTRETATAAKAAPLRIYLGAAPGVGKTYAMLSEGQRRSERGTRVAVAFVETYGRPHTEAMLEGLYRVPTRDVEYRGH